MAEFDNLTLVDSTTGERVDVTAAEWARICKLADDPDDVLSNLPNSGNPDIKKFFDGLVNQMMGVIDAATHTTSRAAADAEDKALKPKGSAIAQSMREALELLSTLTPKQLAVAKSLGALYRAEKVNKAQLRDDDGTQPTVEECSDLLSAVQNMASHPGGGTKTVILK